ncbi:MAG: NAD(P)-dependent oxidoreductase, partial [Candidatus Promineifilaceae bacterium]
MTERIGFIGLGIMGRGMAANILKADFDLSIWNRTRAKMDELLKLGAGSAEDPADLAAQCDVIIVCVSDTPDVQEVILGHRGIIEGIQHGSLVIDMSTISPQATRDIASRLAEEGAFMLDAPISGGSEGAANGTLSIMVGGDGDQYTRALPLF